MTPDKRTEEKRQHSTALVPYSYYECRLPEAFMNVPIHWHSEFELNYISQGRGEFICGNQKFTAGAGDILFLPPNMLHTAYPCKDSELVYHALVFSPRLLGADGPDRSSAECIRPLVHGNVRLKVCIRSGADEYPALKQTADSIFACVHEDSPRADLLLKSGLLRLLWLLETSGDIVFQTDVQTGHGETLRPALEYMAEHFREEITVDQLADLTHLSKSYFMRCFKHTAGIGAMEHLSQLRMNAACEELLTGTKTVSDIAFDCGYRNLSNFNRQFLKKVGCSPKEYRKKIILPCRS